MPEQYSNRGPVYTTKAKYDALVAAGTVEAGREYCIVDWNEDVEACTAAKNAAVAAKTAAETASASATASASSASASASAAQDLVANALWVSFELQENGHLILKQSSQNGTTFYIDHTNGHLMVSYTQQA